MRRVAAVLSAAGLIALGVTVALAQPPGGQPKGPPAAGGGSPLGREMIGKVVQGLRTSPGCLGADLAQLQSGKFAIFGWFESKQAVLDWYNHAAHQAAVDAVWPGRDKARVPLQGVPDDVGPIMVVAAVAPIPKDELKPGQPEGSVRLGIEIYKPLPGGVRFGGGSFSPPGFKPSVRAIDPGSVDVPPAAR